jgi:hypothetical protein
VKHFLVTRLRWDLAGFVVKDVAAFVLSCIVVALLFVWLGCAGARPTLASAQNGLKVACDTLAFVVAEGADVPGEKIAERACNPKVQTAVLTELVRREKALREIVTDPDWLGDSASPAPASDAGAK